MYTHLNKYITIIHIIPLNKNIIIVILSVARVSVKNELSRVLKIPRFPPVRQCVKDASLPSMHCAAAAMLLVVVR